MATVVSSLRHEGRFPAGKGRPSAGGSLELAPAPERKGPRGNGLYVHVPFCERRCHYCDFNVYLLREGDVEGYIQAVLREAELCVAAYGGTPGEDEAFTFHTLYLGGGTPTALSSWQLEWLLTGLRERLPLAPDAEVTVEANPGTLSASKLSALRRGGVDRISLGVQAFQDGHLERLGRIHRARHVEESVAAAREAGFDNVNLDLMFGLPQQTEAEWEETLERALALRPEHLSCYSLIVEEGTLFGDLHKRGRLPLPPEETELAMFQQAIRRLRAAGYDHYEVSNFALPGRWSRHNRIYWENGEWLGLGPGAHSQWKGRRFANVRHPEEYQRIVLGEGRLPMAWEEELSPQVQMEDTLILGLRLREGISLEDFRQRFGVCATRVFASALDYGRREGLVETVGDRLRLTDQGLLLANRFFVELIGSAAL